MTTIPPIPEHLQDPPPKAVAAEPASRLEQLHALYPVLKAAKDDAEDKLKAVTDAIKLELTALDADERRFELTSTTGAPPLRLTWTVSQRIDSKRLKSEQPDLYAAYVKPSGSWTLKAGA